MNYEDVLCTLYGRGFFQIILTVCCGLTNFVLIFEFQSIIFLHLTPEFNCSSTSLNEFSQVTWVTESEYLHFQNLHQPKDLDAVLSNKFHANASAPDQCWAIARQRGDDGQELMRPFSCDQWTFSNHPMSRTLVTDYNLICDRRYLVTLLETIVIMSLATAYSMAIFTDRLSRRKLLLFYAFWDCLTSVGIVLAPNLTVFFIIRALRSLSASICYLPPCIIAELVPTKKRGVFVNLFWIPFGLGYMLTAGIAYLTRDWFQFRLYGLLLLIVHLPLFFIVPESPRWLAVHGRYDEFVKVLKQIAAWNRVKVEEGFYEEAVVVTRQMDTQKAIQGSDNSNGNILASSQSSMANKPRSHDSVLDVARLPNMRRKCLILALAHSSITLCYFGLSINATFTNENVFLNVFFQGFTEIPSAVTAWVISSHVGRRLSLIVLLLLTTLTVIATPVIKPIQPLASTVIAIAGRMAVTTAYCISDLYAAEMFPTTVRNMGIYIIMTAGAVVAALAPYLNRLADTFYCLPALLYGVACALGSVLVFFYLPETRKCPLAQTLDEAERLVCGHEEDWIEQMSKTTTEMNINSKQI
uniref:Solute carrier family 22 member 5 n=1 Tax=Schistocephalus solidus TaxID=70667 RepID=A0A0X3P966_SCHSO